MKIDGREIKYVGNTSWTVDGQHAVLAARASANLRVPATGEIVEISDEAAKAIRGEWDDLKAARRSSVPVSRSVGQPITAGNLAYHMYNPNGRLFG